ncbi:uncharacterized protein TRAVEDRAFT_61417 [Trametes versicolor FP-101664 SS1]|uniref:Uncharacterized protein n=1 Tax=Trametes versicolor (strain FP-101664) TaxID=717944 RepID=R7S7R9_TRAVS|nr:uncharacterized protein TRAVEDRAFT_61417 [Trametes versicolor FP-101664 SS1]EIW52083.1 hypothetical protein TRAVEDRAFT_61417 [Trametes versicolor FP-101664 SS1]
MIAKTLTLAATAAALTASVFAQTPLTINTPAIARQCEHTLITWEGGSGLFFLVVLENGSPIQEFGGLPAGTQSFDWQTNVKKGTNVTLSISDEQRDTAESAPFIIRHGRNNCTVVE